MRRKGLNRFRVLIAGIGLSLLPLSSCASNPDAASIRQAYLEERKIEKAAKQAEKEAASKAESAGEGLAQAGEDLSTAAKIEAGNIKNEATTFFEWVLNDLNGRWEYTKDLLVTPPDQIDEVVARKDEYLPDEDEYRTDEPEETGLGYLEKSETAEGLKDALSDLQEKEDALEEKAGDAVNSLNDESSVIGGALSKAGDAVRNELENTKEEIEDLKDRSFNVPEFSGPPYIEINNNKPFFTAIELSDPTPRIELSDLDMLGRCGPATELIDYNSLPTEQRGEIGMIKPSGWHQAKYDSLKNEENPAGYLYARCHLLAYCLSGLNAEPKNLITGTLTQFNVVGMEPFELKTLYYVKSTRHHVLYRVTPLFRGNNLIADGVLMEAQSLEDDGLSFCVFIYNNAGLDSNVVIDYLTGVSAGR